ncbi:hypothetical protein V8G54_012832 [Vigna mungo]|uniref:Uncharacterized protein n=1 Tax=Vigna mungo TaxID=3915 RepID=A0AAQ3NRX8_VIGMU
MNQIKGTLPDFSLFSSIKTLSLDENRLNGKIPKNIRFPTQLETLKMNLNSLGGVISDSHFANMSKLQLLDLSDNSLALEFSKNWTPSFQLGYIGLRSCKLGPTFPKWFQNDIEILDISNCGISDSVPEWFWSKVATQGMTKMNVSFNKLKGTIPNFPIILGRPFMKTAKIVMNIDDGVLILKDQDEERTSRIVADEDLSMTNVSNRVAKLVKKVKEEEKDSKGKLVHQDSVCEDEEFKPGRPVKYRDRLWVIKEIKANGVIEIEPPYSRRVKMVNMNLLKIRKCDESKRNTNIKDSF